MRSPPALWLPDPPGSLYGGAGGLNESTYVLNVEASQWLFGASVVTSQPKQIVRYIILPIVLQGMLKSYLPPKCDMFWKALDQSYHLVHIL